VACLETSCCYSHCTGVTVICETLGIFFVSVGLLVTPTYSWRTWVLHVGPCMVLQIWGRVFLLALVVASSYVLIGIPSLLWRLLVLLIDSGLHCGFGIPVTQ